MNKIKEKVLKRFYDTLTAKEELVLDRTLAEVRKEVDEMPCLCELCAFEGSHSKPEDKLINVEELLNKIGGKK